MADKPRMEHFLRQYLEEPEYREQLQWVDSNKQVFRVLWMHAGRATFDKELHWKLFHKYREYRGHKNKEDPKQCFGMALKKTPSVAMIIHDKDDDWRYYRFIKKGECLEQVSSGQNWRPRTERTAIRPAHHTIQLNPMVPSPYTTHANSQAGTADCTIYALTPSHTNSQATSYTSYKKLHPITEDCQTHANTQTPSLASTSGPTTCDYTSFSLPPTPTADLDARYSPPLDPDDTRPLPEDLRDLDIRPLIEIHQCQYSTVIHEAPDHTFLPWPSWESLASSSCILSPLELSPLQHDQH
ncbi:hypothetical protein E2C01_027827 [Portunus trituberculatus]|uniref:IRF tryptophan pentad repeat domain-containing protein n=1 Tax=Portunus trituberculatus TaxID=210409 RepID=A0A5B7EML0_PORTR|nr:hypothetical protein [Portunus trituberculatus]